MGLTGMAVGKWRKRYRDLGSELSVPIRRTVALLLSKGAHTPVAQNFTEGTPRWL